MKHEENTPLYFAEDGNFIIRISDGAIMGDGIDLGMNDSISNYKEEPYTEESRAKFFKTIGIEDYKKTTEEKSIQFKEVEGENPGHRSCNQKESKQGKAKRKESGK